jgi:hypothetical protein
LVMLIGLNSPIGKNYLHESLAKTGHSRGTAQATSAEIRRQSVALFG